MRGLWSVMSVNHLPWRYANIEAAIGGTSSSEQSSKTPCAEKYVCK